MVRSRRAAVWLVLLVAAGEIDPVTAAEPSGTTALAVADRVEVVARRELWPGFEPLAIPLAVFDGENTYLFRHPAPPTNCSPVPASEPPAMVCAGRLPAVTANSSGEIGGVVTATLLMSGERGHQAPVELAAVALHEAFHVFQRRRHPNWVANEGDLFRYPIEDGRLLGLRRLESESLRRALSSSTEAEAACWAAQALASRRRRFASLEPAFVGYERLNELNEGLASFIQVIAAERSTVEMPEGGFAAADVRLRAYAAGPAVALLLERLAPGWKEKLEANDSLWLDALLETALEETTASTVSCGLSADEVARVEHRAADDAAAVVAERAERRRRFDTLPGARVEIEAADGQPLWASGLDPLNVERVAGGLLHTRFLHLANDAGELEVLDTDDADLEVLSEGAGPHPLFDGVHRAVVAGLMAKPRIDRENGAVLLECAGLRVRFAGAVVYDEGDRLVVRLAPAD